MTPELYVRAKAIFLKACERTSAELPAFLDAACDDDDDLRREVESLLAFRDDSARTLATDPEVADPVLLAGRYALGTVIGRGGMGCVYEAVDRRFHRRVAVKELSVGGEVYANAFAHEARLLNGLRHPALPVVIDLFVEGEKSYLVMDYVPGDNLKELTVLRLESGLGPWPPSSVLRWADGLLDALQYLGQFAPPIVHRDIKPHNVKITPADGVVLLDFGLAKGLAPSPADEGHSVPGFSLNYAPLEQLRGAGTDVRADVFALGATLVYLLAGFPPPDALARADAVVQGMPDPLDRVLSALPIPAAVSASLRNAMALNRSERPQTAAAFRAILRLAAGSATGGGSSAETRRVDRGTVTGGSATDPAESTNAMVSAAPSNLPQPMTGFLGRERETAELAAVVSSSRVTTLTGPGGIGKTRLALRVAEEIADGHPGGVWFVDLSSLPDASLVAQTVATATGITVPPELPVTDALTRAFAARPALLLLDNCEHVVAASAELADRLVRACDRLRVIATSRERLGIAGERVWPVGPLVVDQPSGAGAESGIGSEAARLFVDRARHLRPSFEVTAGNTAAIQELCRRLEGIPLAIELAAGRVNVLSVSQILKIIDRRLSAFESGDRTVPARQRTLGAALDWSFNLLDADERALIGRLSMFPSGFGLEAVTAVAPGTIDALGLLGRLVDKSLVNVEERRGEARYRLLDTTREYASRALAASGDEAGARRAFVAWARACAAECVRELAGPDQGLWLERCGDEHDALLAALSVSLADPAMRTDALELAAALSGYWQLRGYVREGRVWLERAAAASGEADERLRTSALRTAAAFANMSGDVDRAEQLYADALEIARRIGDPELLGRTLTNFAITLRDQGRLDEAAEACAEGLACFREIGSAALTAIGLLNLGAIRLDAVLYDEAAKHFAECLVLKRRLGDRFGIANVLVNLASVHKSRSEWAEARALLAESLSLRRGLAEKRGLALTLVELATVEIGAGQPDAAVPLLDEAVAIYAETGDRRGLTYAVEAWAQLTDARGEHERALTLLGASAAERERIGTPLLPIEREPIEAVAARARAAVGDARADEAERQGRATPLERLLEQIRD